MSDKIKPTDLEKGEEIAEDQTEKFTQTDEAGCEKHPETSDDISEGMPKTDRENLKDTTDTD